MLKLSRWRLGGRLTGSNGKPCLGSLTCRTLSRSTQNTNQASWKQQNGILVSIKHWRWRSAHQVCLWAWQKACAVALSPPSGDVWKWRRWSPASPTGQVAPPSCRSASGYSPGSMAGCSKDGDAAWPGVRAGGESCSFFNKCKMYYYCYYYYIHWFVNNSTSNCPLAWLETPWALSLTSTSLLRLSSMYATRTMGKKFWNTGTYDVNW